MSAVFSRRPKPIFEKTKTIYGDEMERYSLEHSSTNKFHQDIPKIELEKTRDKIKADMKKTKREELLKLLVFIVIIIIALIAIHYWAYNRP